MIDYNSVEIEDIPKQISLTLTYGNLKALKDIARKESIVDNVSAQDIIRRYVKSGIEAHSQTNQTGENNNA